MNDIETSLAAMQARADAATEGPWIKGCSPVETEKFWIRESGQFGIGQHVCFVHYGKGRTNEINADFIAHARADIPVLVKALLRAVEVIGAVSSSTNGKTQALAWQAEKEIAAILTQPEEK